MTIKEYNKKIKPLEKTYLNCGVFACWSRVYKVFILPLTVVSFALLSWSLEMKYEEICALFNISKNNTWILVFCIIIFLLFVPIIMSLFHEIVHVLSFPQKFYKTIIVLNLPFTISVAYDGELKKKDTLISIISPVVVLTILISVGCIFIKSIYVYAWLMTFNIALASSDIFTFFYIIKTVPQDAYMYGNYYRCQR